ncbi:HU family DNA-binding protein [Segatella hominis]|uniref:HU family DNA-binding protein n=1 Tax=Segatella hominis TaxID=2518605 RepID=UPI003AB95F44
MSKSSLSVLAKAVASKRGLTQAEAERFIATMFEVAGDGIQEDKLLKMKWLGTFKITSVKDRESVDVNTGERILIEGRDKISFTPDNILKEIVNKPFAQFETVVVNDGIDFSDIDEKFANMEREEEELQLQKEQECHDEEVVQEEQPQKEELSQEEEQPREEEHSQEVELNEDLSQEAKKSQESLLDAELQSQEGGQKDELSQEANTPISEETVALSSELKNAEISEDDISVTSEDNISQTSDDTISKTEENGIPEEVGMLISHLKENKSEAEKIERVEEAKVKEEAEVPKAAEAYVEETPAEAKVVVSQTNVENKKQPEYDETLDEDEAYASDRHHLVIPKYVVALVSVVFVALLGGLCWFAFIYGKMQARQEQMEMQLKAIKPQPQPKPKPTVVAPVDTAKSVASSDDKTDAENVLANGAQANNEQTDHAQLAMKKKAKQDSIRMAQANNAVKMAEKASVYLNDPRIRTGAYRIVGVEKTVTAKSGQTLAGLSKLYLGPGMECYMQAINGCSEIKPGQKVKIPKLELKRKGKRIKSAMILILFS